MNCSHIPKCILTVVIKNAEDVKIMILLVLRGDQILLEGEAVLCFDLEQANIINF